MAKRAGDAAKLRTHLVKAHNFAEDSWRLEQAEAEHLRDHRVGDLQHTVDDLYEYIEEA